MARSAKNQPVPLLEWVAAALGLAVAVILTGIIAREALAGGGDEVPILAANVESINATAGGHVVRIVVTNDSGQTAARVEVEGRAGAETSVASVDYVPGHSQAEAGLVFKQDPRAGGLTVRVTGFQLP